MLETIARFQADHPGANVVRFDLQDASLCRRIEGFAADVMLQRMDSFDRGLLAELRAIMRCLAMAPSLGCLGFGVIEEGQLLGFMIVEAAHGHCYHSHFVKADRRFPGLIEMLWLQVAEHMRADGFVLLNDHEDLGSPGLRRFKQSWGPAKYLRRYAIADGDFSEKNSISLP